MTSHENARRQCKKQLRSVLYYGQQQPSHLYPIYFEGERWGGDFDIGEGERREGDSER
jgi:hypothetical protein